MLSTSFLSATQATDSTCDGCNPNNAATITLRQPDPMRIEVEVDVQPSAKNSFAKSATLTANLSSWSESQVRRASMWSLDPATGAFVEVPDAAVDVVRHQLRAGFMKLATSKVKSN